MVYGQFRGTPEISCSSSSDCSTAFQRPVIIAMDIVYSMTCSKDAAVAGSAVPQSHTN